MAQNNYLGLNKVIKDALVENRGKSVILLTTEEKIAALEYRLESETLSNSQLADIHKQIAQLKKSQR